MSLSVEFDSYLNHVYSYSFLRYPSYIGTQSSFSILDSYQSVPAHRQLSQQISSSLDGAFLAIF